MAWGKSARASAKGKRICAAVVGTTAILGGMAAAVPVLAQSPGSNQAAEKTASFAIPAQPLANAIVAFSTASGINVVSAGTIPQSAQSQGVNGTLSLAQALDTMLSGTGYTYRFTGAASVTIVGPDANDAGATVEGAIALDTIDVSGGGSSAAARADAPYQTPGSSAYVSEQTIQRFRGSSPADMFRSVPGVVSSDARNGNAIDVNIRGLQGAGRVPVTIDGAMNSTTAYQGYQGIGNRTYVDPDLISGIEIQKGPSNGAVGGIGGTVSMHTLSADDLIKPGQDTGFRFKGGFGTNTSSVPAYGTKGGFGGYSNLNAPRAPETSGLDRPELLEPTDFNGSAAGAIRRGDVDVVAAFARRKSGNYHAGTHGRAGASSGNVGPVQDCTDYVSEVYCFNRPNYYLNTGLTNYQHGEEVLNSSSDTTSWLLKSSLRIDSDQVLELGYLGFRSEHGEVRSSEVGNPMLQPLQRWLSTAATDTATARYRWNPAGNDLIDFRWNAWGTLLQSRVPTNASSSDLAAIGRPASNVARTLVGSDTVMWGGDASNTSRFESDIWGDISWEYGISYLREETAPTKRTQKIESFKPREGDRQEFAAFTKADWSPLSWLTFNAGMRYQHFESVDNGTSTTTIAGLPGQTRNRSGDGVSPNIGVTVSPVDGLQLFVTYSEGLRSPSLIESTGAYALYVDPNIAPERSQTWEFGGNVMKDGLLAADDSVRMKLAYFDTDVKDYISRVTVPYPAPILYYLVAKNIHGAKFSGFEFSGRYEVSGFSADFGANYYTNVEFCSAPGACASKSLPADYAANHIPPRYMLSLTLAQKFFSDALVVGGRVSHVGPRSADIGTAVSGAATLVAPVQWDPYTLFDAFAEYKYSERMTFEASAENLSDVYYVNPLSNGYMPAPGRTFRFGVTATF